MVVCQRSITDGTINVQNIPRNNKTVKRGFIPKLDCMLFFDYDSIELRLLAFFMNSVGDDSMVKAFKEGKDIHEESAKIIFQKERVTPEERDYGKTFNYATVYGQGVKKCALILGIPDDEAWDMLGRFRDSWPGIGLLSNLKSPKGAIQRQLERRGYITTLHGRHLRPESPHKALNYLIQPTAADIFKESLVKSHKALIKGGFQSHLINAVHDEQVLDAAEEEVQELVEIIPREMTFEQVNEIIPIPIEVEISYSSWADKRSYSG